MELLFCIPAVLALLFLILFVREANQRKQDKK